MNPKRLYAALATAKKAHGFSEDTYQDILARYGATEKDGKISATTMTPAQIFSALDHLNGNELKPGKWQPSFSVGYLVKICWATKNGCY